jgi:hypothetical protein
MGDQPRTDLHMPTYYAAGTTLFSLSSLCAQPFVLLKRRQQVGLVPPSDAGTFRALGDIARSEGIGGLFRSGKICWIPGAARMGYFAAYERVADSLAAGCDTRRRERRSDGRPSSPDHDDDDDDDRGGPPRDHPAWVRGAAGGLSTLIAQLVMAPYSVVSGRLQLDTGGGRAGSGTTARALSASAVLRDVASGPRGPRALWTGYLSAVGQLGPQHAAMWAVSGALQDALVSRRRGERTRSGRTIGGDGRRPGGGVVDGDDDDDVDVDVEVLSLLPRLATCACGSVVAIVVTSPVEVVRARRQAMASDPSYCAVSSGGSGGSGTMPSSREVFARMYHREGARAFVRGIVPRAYANCPGMIAMMVGYEYVKELAVCVERWRRTGSNAE